MQRVIFALAAIGLIGALGFAAFIRALPEPATAQHDEVDGIVVFTGGGGARIAAAMSMFADGAGERLLISGVNPDTSRERLSALWRGTPEMFECCVDLGREAQTTEGNAAEAAQWAKANAFRNVVIVTSEFHMPRSVLVTKMRMPDATITPYPVASGLLAENGWPNSLGAWRQVAGEYLKFVLARIKAPFARGGA